MLWKVVKFQMLCHLLSHNGKGYFRKLLLKQNSFLKNKPWAPFKIVHVTSVPISPPGLFGCLEGGCHQLEARWPIKSKERPWSTLWKCASWCRRFPEKASIIDEVDLWGWCCRWTKQFQVGREKQTRPRKHLLHLLSSSTWNGLQIYLFWNILYFHSSK